VFILDSLLIGSLRFVLDKIASAAEAEAADDSVLRDRLLEAQMQLELGEISDDEFADVERDLLAQIREINRARHEPLTLTAKDKLSGVEIETYQEEGKS
jgi:hypothetical protein